MKGRMQRTHGEEEKCGIRTGCILLDRLLSIITV
jgi:hypothetical protein